MKLGKERRQDFTLLRENENFIYFNSGATALKPDFIVDKLASIYRGITYMGRGFDLAADDKDNEELFFESLSKVAKHINANEKWVIPTYGSTDFLNKVAVSLLLDLEDGDEVILGDLEHASNILPWINIAKDLKKNIIFKWYELKDWVVDVEHLKTLVSEKTKVMAVAHFYNTTGAENDLVAIREAIGPNVKLVVDAAQSVGHTKVDVTKGDVDYYIFGGHKIFATHGIGMAYIKNLLDKERPFVYGGHMQKAYTRDSIEFKPGRLKFIAGSQDVPGVLTFGKAIDYIESIGVNKIEEYTHELQAYAMEQLKKVPKLRIINEGVVSSNVFFEIKGIAGEDVAYHLYTKGIIIRSGANCVKMENNIYSQTQALRVSFHFFNTKEEIDIMVKELIDGGDFIDALFRKRKPSAICGEDR